MNELKNRATEKAEAFTQVVTADERWNLQDELMCQVFGFTAYGYIFGTGRVHHFLDEEDIHKIVLSQLTHIGLGAKYATGLVEAAGNEFKTEDNNSIHNKLIGIGHSHALQENMEVLVNSVFENTVEIRQMSNSPTEKNATESPGTTPKQDKPWWKFW